MHANDNTSKQKIRRKKLTRSAVNLLIKALEYNNGIISPMPVESGRLSNLREDRLISEIYQTGILFTDYKCAKIYISPTICFLFNRFGKVKFLEKYIEIVKIPSSE